MNFLHSTEPGRRRSCIRSQRGRSAAMAYRGVTPIRLSSSTARATCSVLHRAEIKTVAVAWCLPLLPVQEGIGTKVYTGSAARMERRQLGPCFLMLRGIYMVLHQAPDPSDRARRTG